MTTDDVLAHGTRLRRDHHRLVGVLDPTGAPQVALTWDGDHLRAITLVDPGQPTLVVDTATTFDHPVLGPTWRLQRDHADVAVMTPFDPRAPTRLPAIDRPAALPPGTGTLLLNTLARLALDAGIPALRYAGPYPTAALWSSLAQSFRTDARPDAFTAATAARWVGLDRTEIPVDFAPAPFERIPAGPGVHAQLRTTLERVTIDRAPYEPGPGVRRLVALPDAAEAAFAAEAVLAADPAAAFAADPAAAFAAEVWFGDAPYARVATFTAGGALRTRAPLPPITGDHVGATLAIPLVTALAELVVDLVPVPLADSVTAALLATPITWGDPGPTAARDQRDRIVLHAALWTTLAPLGRARLALALAEALAPIAAQRAAAALAAKP